jgi:CxxC motif-containing protein (DUF1111 family)
LLAVASALVIASTLATPALAVAPTLATAAATTPPAPSGASTSSASIAAVPFVNRRDPPPYRKLSDAEATRYELGMEVFNTHFVVAGTPNAGRRDGLGPLFNASSCDECHNNGARGRGPTEAGPLPESLVIQLTAPSPQNASDPEGDPVYGRVFNTLSLNGLPPEGVATVNYSESPGHYPDGTNWTLRVPTYHLGQLRYGPLSPHTVIKPRLAPALFGVGLLDAVDDTHTPSPHGRFGWQASALSVKDQTARAFAREMGLTSADFAHDDCTSTQQACREQPDGGTPEVSAELLDAVVSFQRWLAVPASPKPHSLPETGGKAFADLGCANCHQPRREIKLIDSDGQSRVASIAPYSDLRRHDLGPGLADANVGGDKVTSRWRTAPLWGLGYRMALERHPTFLHDGRARSAEEAILWHDGEAASARDRFERLPAPQRRTFLEWLETL